MNSIQEVEKVLRSAIGMDIESVGPSSIERALNKRMRATGLSDSSQYLSRLLADSLEVQELVECVVVGETWFFRGMEAFAAMLDIARGWRSQIGPGRPLRVLSVPSSTGEEPYSIVMALLDGGFNSAEIVVEAIDVSVSALEKAGAALYSANSFRGNDLAFRDRYFQKVGTMWQLGASVTDQVRFRRRNVVAQDFLADTMPFHIVFCRNLLIYLDSETQSRLVDRLTELLVPKGFLFLGSGEAIALSEKPFVSTGYPMSFSFQRLHPESVTPRDRSARLASPAERHGTGRPARRSPEQLAGKRVTGTPPSKRVLPTPPRTPTPPKTGISADDLVTQARGHANAGRLNDAAVICERLIADGNSTAEVLYLLGVVRDALGDLAQAAECYRKAVYLDPVHTDAMLHLALVREKQGDIALAATLRARARRVEAGGDSRR